MNNQIRAVYAAIIAVICILIYLWAPWKDFIHEIDYSRDINELRNTYDGQQELAEALEKVQRNPQEALVVTTDISGQPRVAIVFDGMPDLETAKQLTELLNKYNAKAVFFVEGQNAVLDRETIRVIVENGQEIGNFTYVGINHLEKRPKERVLSELIRAQLAIHEISGTKPQLFRASATQLTSEVLTLAEAAGLKAGVKSNITVNLESINTPQEADAFVNSVPVGNILSIKLGITPEDLATDAVKTDGQPAMDKKPSVKDPVETVNPKPARLPLAKRFELLLEAFARKKIKVESAAGFRKIKYVPASKKQEQKR